MSSGPDLKEFEALTEAEELRRVNSSLQADLRRAKGKAEDLVEAVFRGARDAAVSVGNPPKIPSPPKDTRTNPGEVALLHLSDLHFGKETDSFDSAVAESRVETLAEKVVAMAAIERSDHPVRECHLMLGGDFVENVDIFPGQAFEVDSNLFEQMFRARKAVSGLLRHLLSDFHRVSVWEEPGNHGRLGRRGDHPEKDSADLLVYRLAREQLAEDEKAGRLVWNETQGWHSIVEIGSYRALLVHGDEIKSFGGSIPAFGISKKVNSWASGVIAPFHDCYMGHFHQPMVLPLANGRGRIFVNPSIESDSPYAQSMMAATGTPGQRLNFVEPTEGVVTSERVLWLG